MKANQIFKRSFETFSPAAVRRSNSAADCFAPHRAAVRQQFADRDRCRVRRKGKCGSSVLFLSY